MRKNSKEQFSEAARKERGQILPWLAGSLVVLLGIAGLSVDVGRAYVLRAQLQNAANAAAMAAASAETYSTSTTDAAVALAKQYSAHNGSLNAVAGAGGITTTITNMCVNLLMYSGETCSKSAAPNAIQVTESASMPTYFMAILGFTHLNLTASALASLNGMPNNWNVAIVLDATPSMGWAPPAGSCTGFSTALACALDGIKTMLLETNPCAGIGNCTAANSRFRVALFSFPDVSTSTVHRDYDCSGTAAGQNYTFPKNELTSYTPLTYSGSPTTPTTYEITPVGTLDGDANGFVYDYYSTTSSKALNPSSTLTRIVAGTSGTPCMKTPGSTINTYYPGAIYAAQAALTAEQNLMTSQGVTTQNAMIVLSDGQANQENSGGWGFSMNHMAQGNPTPAADGLSVISSPTSATGYYPSYVDQCQQAIMAAQDAQQDGTKVFAVAFSSESNGCGINGGGTAPQVDTTVIATPTSGQPAISIPAFTPCITMKNIASPADSSGFTYFYADSSSGTSGCTDSAHPVTTVQNIFSAIHTKFVTAGLLPNNPLGGMVAVGSPTTY